MSKYFSKNHIDSLFKSMFFIFLSVLIIILSFTGKILYYVTPTLLPFVYISSIVLMIVGVIFLFKPQKNSSKINIKHMIYILPLVIGFSTTPKQISQAEVQVSSPQTISDSTNKNETSSNQSQTETEPDFEMPKTKLDKIIFTDSNFYSMLNYLYNSMDEYVDTDIEITGKVFKDTTLKSNEFAIVRPMMSCCAADTTLVGLLCMQNTKSDFENDTWLKITGKVSISESSKGKVPSINVTTFSKIDKPKNEFVYPY